MDFNTINCTKQQLSTKIHTKSKSANSMQKKTNQGEINGNNKKNGLPSLTTAET